MSRHVAPIEDSDSSYAPSTSTSEGSFDYSDPRLSFGSTAYQHFDGGFQDFQEIAASMLPSSEPVNLLKPSDLLPHASFEPGLHEIETDFLPGTRRPLHADLQSALPSSVSLSIVFPTPCPISPVYPGFCFNSLFSSFMPTICPEEKEIIYKKERAKVRLT